MNDSAIHPEWEVPKSVEPYTGDPGDEQPEPTPESKGQGALAE